MLMYDDDFEIEEIEDLEEHGFYEFDDGTTEQDYICDNLSCEQWGIMFTDDGDYLCENCFEEWLIQENTY